MRSADRGRRMTDTIHYGEVWRRAVAGVIDAVIVGIPVGAAALLMPAEAEGSEATLIVLASGLVMFYRMVLEGSSWQATIGKKLLDLKVVTPEGAQLAFAATAVRAWPFWLPGALLGVTGQLLPVLLVVSLAAIAVIPLTARRQGLHDFTARSIVVRRYIEIHPPAAGNPPP